ncbi:hypothetical protein SAMN04487916_107203 [Arthrobacter sp. ov407]|uniref:hypothetical protein n=1 Tax=Arthrobacter sp. ov407 TaxID=1761748 RepID=UPI00088324B7|nr:hypothetical protein [Arthrobacter sp. ov407]SDL29382.1 hypothetical protein SAMN04487916_107203 [Arthrobacter sp. ov407]
MTEQSHVSPKTLRHILGHFAGVDHSPSGWWAVLPLTAARPGPWDVSEPENAELPFPATGAHWLDGWVVSGNIYL